MGTCTIQIDNGRSRAEVECATVLFTVRQSIVTLEYSSRCSPADERKQHAVLVPGRGSSQTRE